MNPFDGILLVSRQDMEVLKKGQQEILQRLERLETDTKAKANASAPYITANEFMQAVRIRRWKFNCLVVSGKIRTLKKRRKIYVPRGEVDRYFKEVHE
jgi:SAM-dependent MidA family methyltransferase